MYIGNEINNPNVIKGRNEEDKEKTQKQTKEIILCPDYLKYH